MSRSVPIPYFPVPPGEYNQPYFQEVLRSFSTYAQQMNTPGPWRATELTLTTQSGNVETGKLSYNPDEDTLDLTHLDGVTQQIGLEQYMRCANETGSTIANGRVVGFAGVNGEIKIQEYIADGTQDELYFIGVTTQEFSDQEIGMVTTYGKVRGLDTTGGGENWSVGDILYASTTVAGGLTNVRPTVPNVVIVVAAVLSVDATDGVILVRPTVPIGLDYGAFASTADQTLVAINTATAITFNTTEVSKGVSLGTPASRLVVDQAGEYQIDVSYQLTSGNSSDKNVYFWLRKNGSDVADTTRAITVNINGGFVPISVTYPIVLEASDYVELYWAADDTNVTLDALASSAFAPSAPSVLVSVTQIQL